MFMLAFTSYYHARRRNITKHRDFAIRLWGQGIASLMYRIWYNLLLGIFLGCEVAGFEDFHRPVDEFLDWWFFVPNLIITEAIVWYLNRRDSAAQQQQHRANEALLNEVTGENDQHLIEEEQHQPPTTD